MIFQLPLLELENVRLPRAKQLYNAGFKTIEQIASSRADEIISKIKILPLVAANKIIKSAKVFICGIFF